LRPPDASAAALAAFGAFAAAAAAQPRRRTALRSLHDVLDWDGARGAWLGTFLVHEPSRALPLFEEAIRAVQRSVMAAHEDGHFMSVKPSVHVRHPRSPQPPLTR